MIGVGLNVLKDLDLHCLPPEDDNCSFCLLAGVRDPHKQHRCVARTSMAMHMRALSSPAHTSEYDFPDFSARRADNFFNMAVASLIKSCPHPFQWPYSVLSKPVLCRRKLSNFKF
jgi:hypothetical protein